MREGPHSGLGGMGAVSMERTHLGKVDIQFAKVSIEANSRLNGLNFRVHRNLGKGCFNNEDYEVPPPENLIQCV